MPRYDVVVVGAGPGGAEAALAAAGAGARTLCLTINLDTTGFHPANPTLSEGSRDPRTKLLAELEQLGGYLPRLLDEEGTSETDSMGRLVADRRLLGLAYKYELEETAGLELRQALVTEVAAAGPIFEIETALDERFEAAAAVIAAGTFLDAEVHTGRAALPGGRRGEIPSNSLSRCLQDMGLRLESVSATASPRLSSSWTEGECSAAGVFSRLPADGSQLCELYAIGLEQKGGSDEQLSAMRSQTGSSEAWINRPAYTVDHNVLAARQVDGRLRAGSEPGLFIAGRLAGCCNYIEAAATGWIAGRNAAADVLPAAAPVQLQRDTLAGELCSLIADADSRPVTIRIPGPGC